MSIEMAPSPRTPHPRDTHECLRRIKFPISQKWYQDNSGRLYFDKKQGRYIVQ